MNFFNLDRQYKLIQKKLIKNLLINFKKGDFIQGKNVKILEEKLLTYSDSKYCLSCGYRWWNKRFQSCQSKNAR